MKRTLLIVVALWAVAIANAQHFENIRTEARDGKVNIVFDLVSNSPGARYDIVVLSSHNNFTSPLTRLTGDLLGVRAGAGKAITWAFGNDLDSFNGNLVFELQGTAIYPLTILGAPGKLKRGRSHQVRTAGGRKDQSFEVSVVSPSGEVINRFNSTQRSSFIVSLDKHLKTSRGYKLVLKGNNEIKEYTFKVTPRVNRVLFVLPVLAELLLCYFFLSLTINFPKHLLHPHNNETADNNVGIRCAIERGVCAVLYYTSRVVGTGRQ